MPLARDERGDARRPGPSAFQRAGRLDPLVAIEQFDLPRDDIRRVLRLDAMHIGRVDPREAARHIPQPERIGNRVEQGPQRARFRAEIREAPPQGE